MEFRNGTSELFAISLYETIKTIVYTVICISEFLNIISKTSKNERKCRYELTTFKL